MTKIQRSVIPAAPGWFVVMVDEDSLRAVVQPVGAWQVVIDSTVSYDDPTVTVEPLVTDGRHGIWALSAPPENVYTGVFGPGQNPLPWAEAFPSWAGGPISAWDMGNWWPSQAPVFAAVDEAEAEAGWG